MINKRIRWHKSDLQKIADQWVIKIRKNNFQYSYKNGWWNYIFTYYKNIETTIDDFIEGSFKFSPIVFCKTSIFIEYKDRLMLKFLAKIIAPVIKNLILPNCYHLCGPSGIKKAIEFLKKSLKTENYRYFIRVDIKDYYASVDRDILFKQIQRHFNDTRLLKYFKDLINVARDDEGIVTIPKLGIARGSSLSPIFGALYLEELDRAFYNNKAISYARYMDDIVILAKTKRQFLKAKRKLHLIISSLNLRLSRTKTLMGELKKGFHFLGVNFAVARTQQDKIHVDMSLHKRTISRALDKINAMKEGAVHTEKVLRYLSRWAAWWMNVTDDFHWGWCVVLLPQSTMCELAFDEF